MEDVEVVEEIINLGEGQDIKQPECRLLPHSDTVKEVINYRDEEEI